MGNDKDNGTGKQMNDAMNFNVIEKLTEYVEAEVFYLVNLTKTALNESPSFETLNKIGAVAGETMSFIKPYALHSLDYIAAYKEGVFISVMTLAVLKKSPKTFAYVVAAVAVDQLFQYLLNQQNMSDSNFLISPEL